MSYTHEGVSGLAAFLSMFYSLYVIPWGDIDLLSDHLCPGLSSLLHKEIKVKLDHLFCNQGCSFVSLFIGFSCCLLCLL